LFVDGAKEAGMIARQSQAWLIRRNVERYPDSPHVACVWPDQIIVVGTPEQAQIIAERLSNWEAGCTYYFYVAGVDD
jgi:hypothetical protein